MVEATPQVAPLAGAAGGLEMEENKVNDALMEKMTSITERAGCIQQSRKEFIEIKSFNNPPVAVKDVVVNLHAYITDQPAKKIDWAIARKGPIFKPQMSLAEHLNIDNLSENQKRAVMAGAMPKSIKNVSSAAESVRLFFVEVKEFIDMKQ